MKVSIDKNIAMFRTRFDEKYDLIQKFRGLESGALLYNYPVDFMESGLIQGDKSNDWCLDVPFAFNTDEVPPIYLNDNNIGANHGYNGAVEIYAPKHNRSFEDIGSIWQDEKGIRFTLLNVVDDDNLIFISENIGESVEKYFFVVKVEGILKYIANGNNVESIFPKRQTITEISRTNRYKEKKVVAIIDNEERIVTRESTCNYAEIREKYDIINPATVAEDLSKQRPVGGYKYQPDLSQFGKPMLSCSLIYRILEDGTVLIIFDYEKLMNVHVQKYLGVMHQEKLDVYGGGIWRYFPKILPFDIEEGHFDFSIPTNILTEKGYPKNIILTREFFNDYNSPCERVVDYFKDAIKQDRLCFASGYLPIYDGDPKIRDKQVSEVLFLYQSRKYYPTFIDKDFNEIKGVAYKKYFIPKQNKASMYSIFFKNKKYLYVDIFKNNTLSFEHKGNISLLEKSDGIDYKIENSMVVVSGEKGYAVFILD